MEADNQRKMVAEATLIAQTIKGAKGFYTTIFLVFLKKKGSVVDVGLRDGIAQGTRNQHMVNAAPLTFVTVGTHCAMSALGLVSHVIGSQ